MCQAKLIASLCHASGWKALAAKKTEDEDMDKQEASVGGAVEAEPVWKAPLKRIRGKQPECSESSMKKAKLAGSHTEQPSMLEGAASASGPLLPGLQFAAEKDVNIRGSRHKAGRPKGAKNKRSPPGDGEDREGLDSLAVKADRPGKRTMISIWNKVRLLKDQPKICGFWGEVG